LNGYLSVNEYANSLYQSYKALLEETEKPLSKGSRKHIRFQSAASSRWVQRPGIQKTIFSGEKPQHCLQPYQHPKYESIEVSDVDKVLLRIKVEEFITQPG
jgi:hypothetical protein